MSPGTDRVRLHRVSRTTGLVEVHLPAVDVTGISVSEQADGSLTMREPTGLALRPVWREAVLREVGLLWAAS